MNDKRLSDAGREARNQYNREWYAANKEKRAAINKRYWEKRAAKLSVERETQNVAENAND